LIALLSIIHDGGEVVTTFPNEALKIVLLSLLMKYYLVFTAVPTIGKFIILNKPGSRIPYFIANQPEGKS
jgi:hypothetical protein